MDDEFNGGLNQIAADFEELVQVLDDAVSGGTFGTTDRAIEALRRRKPLPNEP